MALAALYCALLLAIVITIAIESNAFFVLLDCVSVDILLEILVLISETYVFTADACHGMLGYTFVDS
jgi:hypothetical protein